MKILCISDQIDPLVYSDSIKNRYAGIDFILCAGNLPLDYLDFVASSLNKPLFFVLGNHFMEGMAKSARKSNGCIFIGSRVRRANGLIVAGLGGSIRKKRGYNQFTEVQMYFEAFKLIPRLLYNRIAHGRFLDILLTHAPPGGEGGRADKCHQGFKAFMWIIETFKPGYLVHGQIHLYDLQAIRRCQWGETEVINAFRHCVIDTAENNSGSQN